MPANATKLRTMTCAHTHTHTHTRARVHAAAQSAHRTRRPAHTTGCALTRLWVVAPIVTCCWSLLVRRRSRGGGGSTSPLKPISHTAPNVLRKGVLHGRWLGGDRGAGVRSALSVHALPQRACLAQLRTAPMAAATDRHTHPCCAPTSLCRPRPPAPWRGRAPRWSARRHPPRF
jgi:hypothetical protein